MRITATIILAGVLGLCYVLGGCSAKKYKEKADKQVYDILDKKWDPNFGEKVNYRVSDVKKGANDINVPLAIPAKGVLTLFEAVQIATAHSREYQDEKERLYVSALALTGARHQFEPIFSAGGAADYKNAAGVESVRAAPTAGFSQLLGTGTAISANIALDWFKFLGSGGPKASFGSVLGATVEQPLLRGANPVVVKEGLTQAERNTLYEIRNFNRFRQTFIIQTVNDYYRVLQALDGVENAERSYKSLQIAEERIRMLADAGRLPYFEVDQASQQTLQVYDSYVQAQQEYARALDEFKIKLSLPTVANVTLDPCELKIISEAAITEPNFTVDEATATAIDNRLDLANDLDQLDDAKGKGIVAKDGLKADLNLKAAATASSADRKIGDIQFDDGTYAVGAELDLPIDRLEERNAYRASLLTLERQKRSYQNSLDQVVFEVRQSFRDVREAAARYEIQKHSRDLAQRRVENVNMLLQAGRDVTTRDLLDAESDLLSAQDALTAATVNHTIAKLNFYRSVGILRVRADGMWSY